MTFNKLILRPNISILIRISTKRERERERETSHRSSSGQSNDQDPEHPKPKQLYTQQQNTISLAQCFVKHDLMLTLLTWSTKSLSGFLVPFVPIHEFEWSIFILLLDSLHEVKSSHTWVFNRSFSVPCAPFWVPPGPPSIENGTEKLLPKTQVSDDFV